MIQIVTGGQDGIDLQMKKEDKKQYILVSYIEDKYKIKLGVSRNMKLSTYIKKLGYPSLSKMIDG